MRRKLCIALMAATIVMASGCGTQGGTREENVETAEQEVLEAVTDASEEKKDSAPVEKEVLESKEDENTETDDTGGTKDVASIYSEILDMFYYRILTGWDGTEDVSYQRNIMWIFQTQST